MATSTAQEQLTRGEFERQLIAKAWKDEHFCRELLSDPKATIEREFGFAVPEDIRIHVHEETEDELHLVLPRLPDELWVSELSGEQLTEIAPMAGTLLRSTDPTGECCRSCRR